MTSYNDMIADELYQNYISQIENAEEIKPISPNYEDILKDSSRRLMYESLIFNTIESIYQRVTSDNWRNIIGDFINYLSQRISETNNDLLKSRYASIKAICFKQDVELAYTLNKKYLSHLIFHPLHFPTYNETFYALVKTFCLLKEAKNNTIYELFSDILSDGNVPSNNKLFLISSIIQCDISKFKLSLIPNFYALCYSLLGETTEKNRRKELLLNLIAICEKLISTDISFANKEKELYELLADNERCFILPCETGDIMIPHWNHKTMQNVVVWYKKSGNETKYDEATSELLDIKKTLEIPTTYHNIYTKEQEEFLNYYTEIIFRYDVPTYLSGLSDNFFGIFSKHEHILSESNKLGIDDHEEVHLDLFMNQTKISTEEIPTYYYFRTFHYFVLPCIKNFARQFLDKIADGSLTYHAVKEELLKNTILGKTFQSINGFEVCLYDFIEVPFNSLFLELCKIVNNQPFNLSAPLEILSVKIERLLREILHMRGISILSISPDKEQFLLLDKIFDRLQENDIFGIDDINFFKYALTTQGWNLRNYAAHGLLDFRYYKTLLGIHSCFLLLICILKIAYRVK